MCGATHPSYISTGINLCTRNRQEVKSAGFFSQTDCICVFHRGLLWNLEFQCLVICLLPATVSLAGTHLIILRADAIYLWNFIQHLDWRLIYIFVPEPWGFVSIAVLVVECVLFGDLICCHGFLRESSYSFEGLLQSFGGWLWCNWRKDQIKLQETCAG